MSLSGLQMLEDFRHAAEQFQTKEPEFGVELRTLRQVLEPVHEQMQLDPVYANHDIGVDYLLKYLRQTCHDLQIAVPEKDNQISTKRDALLQSLNNIMEDVQDSVGGIADIGKSDLYNLSKLSDVLRDDAEICQKEMYRELQSDVADGLHDMLVKTADRFDAAQERAWVYKPATPGIDMDAVASNNDRYRQPDVA